MRKRKDPYAQHHSWISRENRQLLKIGIPVVVAVVGFVIYLLTRRVG